MKNKRGFTLIELLAVVVVLGLTFMFIGPKLVSLIKEGEKTETELIEEKILSAAKDYVNNIDGEFYTEFYKPGDINYIYKTDLLKNGLISNEELSKLDTLAGVKGELLEDDKMRYTLAYINVASTVYTNEELYTMIQNLNLKVDNLGDGSGSGDGSIDTSVINDLQAQINENKEAIANINVGDGVDGSMIQNLQSQITQNSENMTNLTNKNNANNVFLQMYPVGSIYVSSTNTNPGTVFGGTWTLVDKRFKAFNTIYTLSTTDTDVFAATENVSNHSASVVRAGNTLRVRFQFYPSIILNDTTYELGTFNVNNLGVTDFIYDKIYCPCPTDGGNGIVYVTVDSTTGVATAVDVVTKTSEGTIAANTNIYCDFEFPITYNFILDSAAGEFHFQRTA